MDQRLVFWAILGMLVVTYIPRVLPIVGLSNKNLPEWLSKWLEMVPAAVLAAMLCPGVLLKDGELYLTKENIFIWASIPTFFMARYLHTFIGAILVGMGVVALGRYLWL